MNCSCAHHQDGTTTTFLCPIHAENDPCQTEANVTGRRRRGSIKRGVCSACGWFGRPAIESFVVGGELLYDPETDTLIDPHGAWV